MKYNWSVVGHENQLELIEKDIESGNLSHAYLLAGTNSVGKYTVAKKMAGILQCENNFCHECPTCQQVKKGCHIDTIEFNDDGESIKIESIRKIIERLNMTRQAKYKVMLIQSVERMGMEAANSFLKILEEPPSRTIFIMTTDNIRMILPTIISRVRVVKFGAVSRDYLEAKLRELFPGSEEETLSKVSLFSMGKTGKAMQLMENPEVLANYLKIYHEVQKFLDVKSIADRFAYVEELFEEPPRVEVFMEILTHVIRTKMLESSEAENSEKYTKLLYKISETSRFLGKNINGKLAMENLMLEL